MIGSIPFPAGPAMADDVTAWLGRLRTGDDAAARPLWDKYFHRLVGLARKRLADSPRCAADEEDLALSAFDSFCRGAEAGRFPDLTDRESLWRLLASFTARKVSHHLRDEGRRKRGGGTATGGAGELEEVLGREPDPALAAEVAEECGRLLGVLGDADLRQVAVLRMDGYSVEEVAARVACAPRSVKRKLQLIRTLWAREVGDGG